MYRIKIAMTGHLLAILLLAFVWTNSHAGNFVSTVCPTPEKIEVSATDYSPLRHVWIECETAEPARIWAEQHLKQWYGSFAPETKSKALHGRLLFQAVNDVNKL